MPLRAREAVMRSWLQILEKRYPGVIWTAAHQSTNNLERGSLHGLNVVTWLFSRVSASMTRERKESASIETTLILKEGLGDHAFDARELLRIQSWGRPFCDLWVVGYFMGLSWNKVDHLYESGRLAKAVCADGAEYRPSGERLVIAERFVRCYAERQADLRAGVKVALTSIH